MVEHFAELSTEEQVEFAKTLLNKINSDKIFSDAVDFEFQGVEVDDITGGMWIDIIQSDPISVCRRATWDAADEEDAYADPGNDADYDNTLREEIRRSFKTLSTQIDGYKVLLKIDDIDEDETVDPDIEITGLSHEDSGIGSYEYWGFTGYDTHPYVEVEGTITKAYNCVLTLFVEPIE